MLNLVEVGLETRAQQPTGPARDQLRERFPESRIEFLARNLVAKVPQCEQELSSSVIASLHDRVVVVEDHSRPVGETVRRTQSICPSDRFASRYGAASGWAVTTRGMRVTAIPTSVSAAILLGLLVKHRACVIPISRSASAAGP